MVLRNDVNEKFVKALETCLTIPNGQLKMEFDPIGNDFLWSLVCMKQNTGLKWVNAYNGVWYLKCFLFSYFRMLKLQKLLMIWLTDYAIHTQIKNIPLLLLGWIHIIGMRILVYICFTKINVVVFLHVFKKILGINSSQFRNFQSTG